MNKKVFCVICNYYKILEEMLIPALCLKYNGKRAHRICKDCWFSNFAIENVSHKCPGCINKLLLNNNLLESQEIIIIDY